MNSISAVSRQVAATAYSPAGASDKIANLGHYHRPCSQDSCIPRIRRVGLFPANGIRQTGICRIRPDGFLPVAHERRHNCQPKFAWDRNANHADYHAFRIHQRSRTARRAPSQCRRDESASCHRPSCLQRIFVRHARCDGIPENIQNVVRPVDQRR